VSALKRAAADACLEQVFGEQYGDLTTEQAGPLITDLIDMNKKEGLRDLYTATQHLKLRIQPASLRSYTETLQAGRP
jgi:hypothetical protein